MFDSTASQTTSVDMISTGTDSINEKNLCSNCKNEINLLVSVNNTQKLTEEKSLEDLFKVKFDK